jgi:hypothetical protein
MKRLLIFAAAVRLAMTAIHLQGQDAEVVAESPSTTVTSTITRNRWLFDTLHVYGTLTNVNVTMKVIGFDKNQKLVTESTDYTILPEGTFHASLTDTNKEIKFVKVVLYDKTASNSQVVLGWTLAESIQAYGQPTMGPFVDSFGNPFYRFEANGHDIRVTYYNRRISSVAYLQRIALDESAIRALLSDNAPGTEWVADYTQAGRDVMWIGKVGDKVSYHAYLLEDAKTLKIITEEYFAAGNAASDALFVTRAVAGLGYTLEESIKQFGQPVFGPKYEGLHSSYYLFKAKGYDIGAHYFEGELSRIAFNQPDAFEEKLVDAFLSVNAPKVRWSRPLNGGNGETNWLGSIGDGESFELLFFATLAGDGKTLMISTKEDNDRNKPWD